jgi:hypothetical protein
MGEKKMMYILAVVLMVVFFKGGLLASGILAGVLGTVGIWIIWTFHLPFWMRKMMAKFALITDLTFGWASYMVFGGGGTVTGLVAASTCAILSSIVLLDERRRLLKKDIPTLASVLYQNINRTPNR